MFREQKTHTQPEGLEDMTPSIIGADLTVTGNITSKGTIQLEGEVQGDVFCANLIVGAQGRITGGITAEDVDVHGRVVGSIRAGHATLQSTAHVEGDIYHQSLKLEHGGFFEGKSLRSDDQVSIFEGPVETQRESEADGDTARARNAKLHRVA